MITIKRWIVSGVALLAIYSLSGLSADQAPRVMVSVKPVHSLVAGLMAGIGEPELLVTQGSPLDHAPSQQQLDGLESSNLVIWIGPELEPGLADPVKRLSKSHRVLELLDAPALKILPARHGQDRDPFFWLDSRNMMILLDLLASELVALDPVRAHRYETNRRNLMTKLSKMDRELEYGYKYVSSAPIFLYHDTQQYFEQSYAMKVAGFLSDAPGLEASAERLLLMRDQLAKSESACLFTEAGMPSPHLAVVTDLVRVRTMELDSLGTGLEPGPDLYLRLMRDHYRAIRDCLGERGTQLAHEGKEPPDPSVELYSHKIEGKYLLQNHFGETVSNLDFRGRYQLIYFGYTFCPDICPTSLATMGQALKRLGTKADRVQPLFITVDPQRDTLEVLRKYTEYFHPSLLGLTGPPAMIERTAKKFRVRYEKVEEGRDPDKYAMDHTSALFLLGPDSRFIAKFAHGFPAKDLATRLDELIPDG